MSTKVSRFLTLGFVFSIALVLVFSPLTLAFDITRDVQFMGRYGVRVDYFEANITGSQGIYKDGDYILRNGNSSSGGGITRIRYITTGVQLSAGDFVQVSFTIGLNANNNSSDSMVRNFPLPAGSHLQPVDTKFSMINTSNGMITFIYRAEDNYFLQYLDYSSTNVFLVLYPAEYIQSFDLSLWHPLAQASNQDIINAINNNSKDYSQDLDDINDGISDLRSSQEQANEDANDRYDDEKDTISNNGNDAQDSADSLSFSGFSVGNPLLNWIALFTDNTCVSIPTIASWIHSNETSVCSPWSSSVRAVTTPIISVLSGTVLFGFIVHWLKQKDGQELS